MRLAIFDTNVVVPAGLKPGSTPAKLVMDWVLAGQVQLVTCPSVIAEYNEVAARSKFARYGFPPAWLDQLIDESLRLPDPPQWTHSVPDAKDTIFLALAHTSGAWLVTGNLKHFPKPGRHGVTVLSPAEYLDHLRERRQRFERVKRPVWKKGDGGLRFIVSPIKTETWKSWPVKFRPYE